MGCSGDATVTWTTTPDPEKYDVCVHQGHIPTGEILTSDPPWSICARCRVAYRFDLTAEECGRTGRVLAWTLEPKVVPHPSPWTIVPPYNPDRPPEYQLNAEYMRLLVDPACDFVLKPSEKVKNVDHLWGPPEEPTAGSAVDFGTPSG